MGKIRQKLLIFAKRWSDYSGAMLIGMGGIMGGLYTMDLIQKHLDERESRKENG